MISRFSFGVFAAVALTAVAIGAAPSQDAAPPSPPGPSAAALTRQIEIVRHAYAAQDLSGARQELLALIDLVRAARGAEGVTPPRSASGRLPRAGLDVPMPGLLKRRDPEYPLEAAMNGVTGYVVIDLVIDKSGRPRDLRLVQGHPWLAEAAIDAVRQWRFAKPDVGGPPADIEATTAVFFSPRREAPLPDEFDLARFFIERNDYAAAEAPLTRALARIVAEAACMRMSPDEAHKPPYPDGLVVNPPRLLTEVKPVYPPVALNARVEASVLLEAIVEVDGRPACLRVLKSVPLLDQAALDAVSKWKFAPGTANGKPVPVYVNMDVNFALRKK